ncbi:MULTISPECIES: fumarylacetoacetate hydrolase family protein [Streptomyces]|uniref:fumarylacetoacetate hydrolase family protein n=1 Tax=Streptomyces lycopersici TaxID=2974589 RepID=UPI0021CEC13A|nr:fumarylacetoacetate hydrolase family protein [Streptomyces sp. NEAU-383]
MRVANLSGRLSLVTGPDQVVDVRQASAGWFDSDVQGAYERWDELVEFAAGLPESPPGVVQASPEAFGNPVPAPRQVFGIGLNYADHAGESSFAVPDEPPVFTKFASSLADPYGEITLPPGTVDWEVELVVVMGRRGHRVAAKDAWSYVAGLSVGQDLSERGLQRVGPAPQFSLAKSYPGFGPVGPVVVTPDELPDRNNLELGCLINGEQMQKGHTSDMVFDVPELIARLSAVIPLLPGDVIFTGTPAGVGLGRTPERYLAPGDELVSYVRGIGEMRHRMVAGQ